MKSTKRVSSPVVWLSSLLLLSACGVGGGSEGSSPAPDPESLASIDPCSLLAPAQTDAAGAGAVAEPYDGGTAPACEYNEGDILGVSVYVDPNRTVESSEQEPVWAEFERLDVNGRTGARAINSGSTQAKICSTLFDAGNGMIKVTAQEKFGGEVDECAESLKLARKIESGVPS